MKLRYYVLTGFLALSSGCLSETAELGTKENPIKLYFVPSVDAAALESNAKIIERFLEDETGYEFKTGIPASYIAVVEAFGTNRVDVAALNTFGYLLANQKYDAEARIAFRRHGEDTFAAQIISRADGPVQKLEDIAGKKFAFVDPASTSGYILPEKLLRDKGIEYSEKVFAGRHDNVVTMVYQGQVDAGATFHSPPFEGEIKDARRLVLAQFPDVEQVIQIVSLTDSVPIEPMVFRKDMPEEAKKKIVQALMDFIKTPAGAETFEALYDVSDLRIATDADYDGVRKMLQELELDAGNLMKK